MTPLAAELTSTVEAIELENPGIFGQRGAYGQVFSLFTCALAMATMLGPLFSGILVANYGWNFMTMMLAVLSASGVIPVVRTINYSQCRPSTRSLAKTPIMYISIT